MSLQRHEQSLDGKWQFIPDAEATGIESEWFKSIPKSTTEVDIPGHWSTWTNSSADYGWLFHTFNWSLPQDTHHAFLVLDGLGQHAEVWLNGSRLGTHPTPLIPTNIRVTDYLVDGKNILSIRIAAPEFESCESEKQRPLPSSIVPKQIAGLLSGAKLQILPDARIIDIHIQPDCRRNVLNVNVEFAGGDTVRATILDTSYQAESNDGELCISIEEYENWSPASPRLQTLRCELMLDGKTTDVLELPFAMTEFTIKDNRFCLNNRPFWLKGVQHEIAYPATLSKNTWSSEANREIETARKCGFNLLLLRAGIAPEETLVAADTLGIMVALEIPESTGEQVKTLVQRVRNHPCLAFYCATSSNQVNRLAHMQFIRDLDPLRPILSGPGNSDGQSGFLRPFRDIPEVYEDIQLYQPAPLPALTENYLRSVGNKDSLSLLSGFAAAGPGIANSPQLQTILDEARKGFDAHGLERSCGEFEGLLKAGQVLQRASSVAQIDAIRANPNLAGYIFRQLRDTGSNWYGILDVDGNEKPIMPAIADTLRPARPLIRMAKSNLVLRETMTVSVLFANEHKLEGRADLSLQVVGPTNQVLWKKRRGVKIPKHGRLLWEGEVSASGSPGMHKFVVRVIQENRVIAQSSAAFYVITAPELGQHSVNLLDPHGVWGKVISQYAHMDSLLAPIHILPPLANTIAGYPDNALMQILAQVKGGAAALFFSPPEDWNTLAEHLEEPPLATTRIIGDSAQPAWHYAKLHPTFSGLPTRGLMARPYRSIAPLHTFSEESDEDICGTFRAGDETSPSFWGSGILVCRYGEGRLVFIHLRILENLGFDPIADHLFNNLLAHFSRRSVPSKTPLHPYPPAVEWLRKQRDIEARRWMVVGEFPFGEGIDTPHPPETEIEFGATYPGWYQAISWRPWYSRTDADHWVNLQPAFGPLYQNFPRHDRGTGYAYAEFNMDRRQAAILCLSLKNATKVWLNGKEILARIDAPENKSTIEEIVPVFFRQGRNTLLVKCSKESGPFGFALDIHGERGEAVPYKWWR